VGLGRALVLNAGNRLYLYVKYLVNFKNEDWFEIDSNNEAVFPAAWSKRLRGGVRWTKNIGTMAKFQAGVGYEREFDGHKEVEIEGYELSVPKFKEGSYFGEAGLSFRRGGVSPISFGLNVEGYDGRRKGLGASVNVTLEF
jgi:hypothetical protein